MTLTYENWDEKSGSIFDNQANYLDVLKWAFQEYSDQISYACSFGAEGIVLLDLISKINKKATILFLDTALHFPETYQLIEKIKTYYPSFQITMLKPKISLEEQEKWYGEELWKDNPNLCCYIRKVVPLREALKDSLAWISGLRKEQSPLRENTEYLNKDDKFQKIKICPLINWSWDDVNSYIQLNKLPYNPLHDKGYPSIGCAPCTMPISEGEDIRAGRWAGKGKTECGLHQS